METQISLRVHIVPVGRDIKKRTLAPILKTKPEKIYLLTMAGKDAMANEFENLLLSLKNDFDFNPDNIIPKKVNYYSLIEFLELIGDICRIEYENKNRVFFNISGGTMVSVAGTLSTLYFGTIPYFPKKNYIDNSIEAVPTTPPIPKNKVELPSFEQITLLYSLFLFWQNTGKKPFPKSKCISILKLINPETDITDNDSSGYNKLFRRYLRDFHQKGYIQKSEYKKRQMLTFTEEGEFNVRIFSAYLLSNRDSIKEKIASFLESK